MPEIASVSSCRREKVYALFSRLGIAYQTAEHPPLFTQADNEKYRLPIDAVIFKNLFLRNKNKSQYYLLSLPLEKKADLLSLQRTLGETRLSFGGEAVLSEKLRVRSGSVSLLNIVDAEKTDVIFLIDETVFEYERIGVHPNDNTATIMFAPDSIPKILDCFAVQYRFVTV